MEQQNDDRALLNALEENESGLDIKAVISFLWRLKWWMLLCLCFTLPFGRMYVKKRTPVYTVSSKAVFVEYQRIIQDLPLMRNFSFNGQLNFNKDEMIQLRSASLMANVIDSLDLATRYYRYVLSGEEQEVRYVEYYKDAPFVMNVDFTAAAENVPTVVEVEFKAYDNGHYDIIGVKAGAEYEPFSEGNRSNYGDQIKFRGGTFNIVQSNAEAMIPGSRYKAVYTASEVLARRFLSGFSVSFERFVNQSTNVVVFNLYDEKIGRAVDILNKLVPEYNREYKEYLCRTYKSSIEFIDTRLNELSPTDPIYGQLKQRREEMQLSMYSLPDRMKVVESAVVSAGAPRVSKKKVYIVALLAGLLLPVAVVILRNILRTKVEKEEDLKKKVHRTAFGVIPKATGGSVLYDAPLDESFNMLRSNLKYIDKQVLQVTSSMEGEGKTFISVNFALSLSQLHKRVALLELDFRYPSFEKYFQEEYDVRRNDLVNYLSGHCDDISLIPVEYGGNNVCGASENNAAKGQLDIFFAGLIPPNPTELLSDDKLKSLLDYCRANYDYVICDAPAYMSLADATIVNSHVDATLYVVRCDYTKYEQLSEVRELFDSDRLTDAHLLLNAFNVKALKYLYAYRCNNRLQIINVK